MADDDADLSKRRFLLTATSVATGAAAAAASVPFVASMLPSERAKAAGAPVEGRSGQIQRMPLEQCVMTFRTLGALLQALRRNPHHRIAVSAHQVNAIGCRGGGGRLAHGICAPVAGPIAQSLGWHDRIQVHTRVHTFDTHSVYAGTYTQSRTGRGDFAHNSDPPSFPIRGRPKAGFA